MRCGRKCRSEHALADRHLMPVCRLRQARVAGRRGTRPPGFARRRMMRNRRSESGSEGWPAKAASHAKGQDAHVAFGQPHKIGKSGADETPAPRSTIPQGPETHLRAGDGRSVHDRRPTRASCRRADVDDCGRSGSTNAGRRGAGAHAVGGHRRCRADGDAGRRDGDGPGRRQRVLSDECERVSVSLTDLRVRLRRGRATRQERRRRRPSSPDGWRACAPG